MATCETLAEERHGKKPGLLILAISAQSMPKCAEIIDFG